MKPRDHFRDDFKCEHFDNAEPCPALYEHACVADKKQGLLAADVNAFVRKIQLSGMDGSVVLATAFLSQLSTAPFPLRAAFARRIVGVLTRNTKEGMAPVDYRLTQGKEEEEQRELMEYMKKSKIPVMAAEKLDDLNKVYPCTTPGCPGDIVRYPPPRNYWACPVCAMHFGVHREPSKEGEAGIHE